MGSTIKAAQQLSKEMSHLLTPEQRVKIHSASSNIHQIEDKYLRSNVKGDDISFRTDRKNRYQNTGN